MSPRLIGHFVKLRKRSIVSLVSEESQTTELYLDYDSSEILAYSTIRTSSVVESHNDKRLIKKLESELEYEISHPHHHTGPLLIFSTLFVPILLSISILVGIFLVIQRKMRRSKSLKVIALEQSKSFKSVSSVPAAFPSLSSPSTHFSSPGLGSSSTTKISLSLPQLISSEFYSGSPNKNLEDESYDDVVDHEKIHALNLSLQNLSKKKRKFETSSPSNLRKKKREVDEPIKRSLTFKNIKDTLIRVLNIPKRIGTFRQKSAEKKRFNVYNISNETREQLKHIYVY